jgi:hypothetical protein
MGSQRADDRSVCRFSSGHIPSVWENFLRLIGRDYIIKTFNISIRYLGGDYERSAYGQ